MRVLNTPPHAINLRTLATTLEDLQPFTDLLQTGFQPNFPFPSSVPLAGDDSTISSGSTSTSTVHRDFVSGFPVEHHDRPETPVQHTIDSSGRKVVTIGTLSPGESEQPTLPIPISSPMRPAYDPLRLLSPLEKDCPRLISADEQAVRTFIAAYKEYRRAGGVLCAYTINDLISIEVRQIFRMSSV
jgi:hypothetical protein